MRDGCQHEAATSAESADSGARRVRISVLALGELSGSVGLQVALFAIPLIAVKQLHATPLQMGILNLFDSAAALSFGFVIGASVDRLGGVVALCVSEAIRFAALVALVLTLTAGPTLTALFVAMFAVGAASLMHDAGVSTAVVEFGDRSSGFLNRANALLRGSSVVSELAGPGVAGVLVAALGFAASLIGGALAFAIAALCAVAVIRVPPASRTRIVRRTATDAWGVTRGIRYIWKHDVLRPLVMASLHFNFFTAAFQAVFLVYCVRTLGFSTIDLAVMGIAGGVGGIAGSVVVARRAVHEHQKAWYLASLGMPVASVAAILWAALLPAPLALGTVSAAELIWSFAMAICVVLFNTLRQLSSPDHLVGQVAASERVLALAGEVPGALIGGLAGTAAAIQAPMFAAMVGIGLSVLWVVRLADWSPAATAKTAA